VKLRDSMHIVTGCLKPTPVQWLTVMSAIAPPHLRREEMNRKWIERAQAEEITPLQKIFKQAPSTSRLKSRSPFYLSKKLNYNTQEKCREEWNNKKPKGGRTC